jgi:hypothetical protein
VPHDLAHLISFLPYQTLGAKGEENNGALLESKKIFTETKNILHLIQKTSGSTNECSNNPRQSEDAVLDSNSLGRNEGSERASRIQPHQKRARVLVVPLIDASRTAQERQEPGGGFGF